jgi:hypothetical protein
MIALQTDAELDERVASAASARQSIEDGVEPAAAPDG